MPPGPPPSEPPRGRSRLTWILPCAAVAVVAVILAALALSGGGGKSPAASHNNAVAGHRNVVPMALSAWEATQQQYDAMGAVTYGDELVVTADTGVYAYDRGSGNLLWTVKPPASGSASTAFCGSGQNAVNGEFPVGFGVQTDPVHHMINCTSVGLVDLRSGKLLWTQLIPTAAQLKADPLDTPGMLTEISGNTVMATWNGVGAAFSATGGHRLWTQAYSDEFRDLAVANGAFYGLFVALAPLPGEAPMALDGINPANGDILSRLHMTAQMTHTGDPAQGAIVGTSPMTLLVNDESANSDASYLVLDQTKQHIAAVIPAGAQSPGAGQNLLDAMQTGGNTESHPYIKAAVGGGVLVTVTYPAGSQSQDELVAYDLATGARRWSATVKGVKMIAPVAVDGSTVIGVGSTGTGLGDPTLVRVSLASGTVLSSTPRPTGQDPMSDQIANYHFTWSDGRAYAVDWDQTSLVASIPELFTLSGPRG